MLQISDAKSVADLIGPWSEPGIESGLVERCRRGWYTPVAELTNQILATYLRQRIGLTLVVPEARKRLAEGYTDDTEQYDEELSNALNSAVGDLK